MVAVIIGGGLGLERSSASAMGAQGQWGDAAMGRSGESVRVNAANGNLIIQRQDEMLVGMGPDSAITRTYNSKGDLTDDNGDNWRLGVSRKVSNLTGTLNAAHSTVTRTDWDGSQATYTWNADYQAYLSVAGHGPRDLLTFSGSTWSWTDGESRVVERYDASNGGRVVSATDTDGNALSFAYNAQGLISRVTTADGGYSDLVYAGTNLTQVVTVHADVSGAPTRTLTRVRYGYDAQNRLSTVVVDLSPDDNTITDGNVYVTTYTYDHDSKRVASISQSDGSRLQIVYTLVGDDYRIHSLSQSIAAGVSRTTTFRYDASDRTTMIDASGQETVFTHSEGHLTQISAPPASIGQAAQITTFTYYGGGELATIRRPDGALTIYGYEGASNRAHAYDALGNVVNRRFGANNQLLNETRYVGTDTDIWGPGLASGAMTDRYAYDSNNRLAYKVTAQGRVTAYTYDAAGRNTKVVEYTAKTYDTTGLNEADVLSKGTLDGWVAGMTDKTGVQLIDTLYDFRGNIFSVTRYEKVLADGTGDLTGEYGRDVYVYDQAGQLLSRRAHGASGSETFVHDGLGRVIASKDFKGDVTRTVFRDQASTTIVGFADGLTQVSVYNLAGELISQVEAGHGENLMNLGGWPEDPANVPSGPATLPAWHNVYVDETRWTAVAGPQGNQVVAIEAGQTTPSQSGGGNYADPITIDDLKAYEFVYYFQKTDLSKNSLHFGLTANLSAANVENAATGADDVDPYFFSMSPSAQQATLQAGRWYKVVGYVLPKDAVFEAGASPGGVYDMSTGDRIASTTTFRWNENRSGEAIYSRFFTFNDQDKPGFTTRFYKPEVRSIDTLALAGVTARGGNLVSLIGWPSDPANVPTGYAVVNGWNNVPVTIDETRWGSAPGPDGGPVMVMEAGQTDATADGNGNQTNQINIDRRKAYEFTYYFRKTDTTKHSLLLGLSYQGATAFVEDARTGVDVGDPYFFSPSAPDLQAMVQQDRWYKVVGYVLAEGATAPIASLGGVYDMQTGQKIASTTTFRWNDAMPADTVHSRAYVHGEGIGFSTQFYKPEVREATVTGFPDPASTRATTYRYDAMGRLRLVTDATGVRTHHLYDRVGRKVADIQADGGLVEYRYDANDRLTATIRHGNAVSPAQMAALVDAAGNPSAVELASIRPAASSADSWNWRIYDTAGRLVQTIDPTGASVAYAYDGSSRLIARTEHAIGVGGLDDLKVTPPTTPRLPGTTGADRITRYFHDADGRQIGVLDAEGYLTRTVHDGGGREIQTQAFAAAAPLALRASGGFADLLSGIAAGPDDIRTWSIHDGRGLLRGTVDGAGHVTLYAYDAMGHMIQRVGGRKLASAPTTMPDLAALAALDAVVFETVNQTRDAYGRVLTESHIVVGGTEVTRYAYDSMGRLVRATTDPLIGPDRTARSRYDRLGRLIGELSGEGAAALAALGPNPTSAQMDQVYRAWGVTYGYDDADRMIFKTTSNGTDANALRTVYHYDTDGNLTHVVNAMGEVTQRRYDVMGRETETIVHAARLSAQATAGLTGGLLTSATRALLETISNAATDSRAIVAYDVAGRIDRQVTADGRTTTYAYNAFHQVERRDDPVAEGGFARTISAYDRRGLLTRTTLDAGRLNFVTSQVHDAFGRPVQTTDANGRVRATAYDRAGRTIRTTDALERQTTFSYDDNGNRISLTDRDGRTTTWSYDAFNRRGVMTTAEGLVTVTVEDAFGLMRSIVQPDGRATTYAYDADGRMTSSADGMNNETRRIYDKAGRLAETIDARGTGVVHAYDAANRLLTETVDPAGLSLVTTYTYDGKGQQTRVTDPSGRVTEIHYDLGGRKVEVTVDPDGLALRTVYAHDQAGTVARVIEGAGSAAERVTHYGYDSVGRLANTRIGPDGLNGLTHYGYDGVGNVVMRTDGAGATTRYVHDAENRLAFEVDATGSVTGYVHDAEGRVIQRTRFSTAFGAAGGIDLAQLQAWVGDNGKPGDQIDRTVFDRAGRPVYAIDAENYVTETRYDAAGRAVRTIRYDARIFPNGYTSSSLAAAVAQAPAGRTTRATYDAAGRQSYAIDAEGYVTIFAYDGTGNVTRTTRYAARFLDAGDQTHAQLDAWTFQHASHADHVARTVHDAAGRPVYAIDAENYVTETRYDAAGRAVRTIRYDARIFPNGYTSSSLAAAVAQAPAGRTTRATYDAAGRQSYAIDAEGYVTIFAYDGTGNVTRTTRYAARFLDAGDQTHAQLDAWTFQHASHADHVARTVHDAAGRPVYAIDAENYVTETRYDAAGRAVRTIRYDARITIGEPFTAASAAKAIAASGSTGRTTLYGYDAMGRVISTTASPGDTAQAMTLNTYDAFGDLVKVVDARGNAGYFYHDRLGRLTLQIDPEGHATTTTYGQGVEAVSVTRHAARATGVGSLMVRPTLHPNVSDATTTFERDRRDLVVKVVDAEGHYEIHGRDAFGDVVAFGNKLGGVTVNTYDKRGLKLSETLPVGSTAPDGTSRAPFVTNRFEYDAHGNLVRAIEADGLSEARNTHYTYDRLNRMVRKTGDRVDVLSRGGFNTFISIIPTQTLAHDAFGNVIELRDGSEPETTVARTLSYYDRLNRKTAEIDAVGTLRTWAHDALGNVVTERVHGDAVGHPSSAGGVAPAPVSTMVRETEHRYDRAGRRVQTFWPAAATGVFTAVSGFVTSTDRPETREVHDAMGNVVSRIDARGNASFAFYDRLGRQVASVDAENYLTVFQVDAEGNVLRETRHATRIASNVGMDSDPTALAASIGQHHDDRITEFGYDRNGRRLFERRLNVLAYTVDGTTGAMAQTSATAQIAYAYDGLGNVVRRTEANGDAVDYVHDLAGRQTEAVGPAFFDHTGSVVRKRTRTSHDGLNHVVRVVEGEGDPRPGGAPDRVTTFVYGLGGRLAAMTDATGFTRGFAHDAAGRVVRETYAVVGSNGLGRAEGVGHAYDAAGRATLETRIVYTQAQGWITGDRRESAYNAHGEVSARGVNGGWQERFDYDAAGRLWRSSAQDGVLKLYLHDKAGDVTATVVSTGTDLSAYGPGNVVSLAQGAADPNVALTLTVRDRRGQAVATYEVARQLGEPVPDQAPVQTLIHTKTYDAFGAVVAETDALGYRLDFVYNTLGRMAYRVGPEVAHTDETGHTAIARPIETYRHDLSGRLVGLVDALGRTTTRHLQAGTGHAAERADGIEPTVLNQFNPDGSRTHQTVDVFGDVRVTLDGLGRQSRATYDAAGRLIRSDHPTAADGVTLSDHYAYDGLGRRVAHWNSHYGAGTRETTDYDLEGRVARTVDYVGTAIDYRHDWDGELHTAGMGTFGGWALTTTHADQRTTVQRSDLFGRSVSGVDLAGVTSVSTYDRGGRRVGLTSSLGQAIDYVWLNTGRLASVIDRAGRLYDWSTADVTTTYGYDAVGNRVRERHVATHNVYGYDDETGQPTRSTRTVVHQDASAGWDGLGRMTVFQDQGVGAGQGGAGTGAGDGGQPATVTYRYDLAGNVRNIRSDFAMLGGSGSGARVVQDLWYRYDAMNRFTTVKGALKESATPGVYEITRGLTGVDLAYDAAGQRTLATTTRRVSVQVGEEWVYVGSGARPSHRSIDEENWERRPIHETRDAVHAETYAYGGDGHLTRVHVRDQVWNVDAQAMQDGPTTLRGVDVRDALGRVTYHGEYLADGVTIAQDRYSVWNARSDLVQETVFTRQANAQAQRVDTVLTHGASAWGDAPATRVVTTSQTLDQPGSTRVAETVTALDWAGFGGPRVASVTHTPDMGANVTHVSTYRHDANGALAEVRIQDGRPRTVTYVTDVQGQVLDRTETSAAPQNPRSAYLYFDGVRVGDLTNDGDPSEADYAATVNARARGPQTGPFRNGGPTPVADFDQTYEPITPGTTRASGQSVTVRDGDTLASIAAAAWGDASLWWMIAETNGLTASSVLLAGQVLTLPPKVANRHSTAETFRPYDPNRALGDLSPTRQAQIKPVAQQGKKGGCGAVGQIIAVAVAVAVVIATKGAATKLAAGLLNAVGVTGAAAATAATVAGATIAGAAGSIASQGFNIATGAQDRLDWKGVGLAALSAGYGGGAASGIGGVISSAVNNATVQAIAVATGLQDRFSWSQVAVAAIVSGVSDAVGARLPGANAAPDTRAGMINVALSNTAGAIAGAGAQSLIQGNSFGDTLMTALPSVIGNTIGDLVGQQLLQMQQARSGIDPNDRAGVRGYGDAAMAGYANGNSANWGDSYEVAGTVVANGERSLWQKVRNFARDPVGSVRDFGDRITAGWNTLIRGQSVPGSTGPIDYTITNLEEIIVTGNRNAQRGVVDFFRNGYATYVAPVIDRAVNTAQAFGGGVRDLYLPNPSISRTSLPTGYADAMGNVYPGTGALPGNDYNPIAHPWTTASMAVGVIASPYAAIGGGTAITAALSRPVLASELTITAAEIAAGDALGGATVAAVGAGGAYVAGKLADPVSEMPGRSAYGRFDSADAFGTEAYKQYQAAYEEGYGIFKGAADADELIVPKGIHPNTIIGQRTDAFARGQMERWLALEGIAEGPKGVVMINRRLYDPLGSGAYRVPDFYIPETHLVLDGTIARKWVTTPQVRDFNTYSGGNTTLVRPIPVGGSYSPVGGW